MCRNPLPYLLLALVMLMACTPPAPEAAIRITSADQDRDTSPIRVLLDESFRDASSLMLLAVDRQTEIPAQRDGAELVFIPPAPLKAGEEAIFYLKAGKPAKPTEVRLDQDRDALRIFVAEKPVLQYNIATVEPPEGIESHFRRSGYIHPLYSPEGAVLSGDMSHDHAHQHGVFFAWVNTTFQGRDIDFWNQAKENTRVSHVAVLDTASGPVFARFQVSLLHEDMSDAQNPIPVLEEEWTVTIYHHADPFIIDFESVQVCVADSPLHLNQYHYGGMAFRGSNEWVVPEDSAKVPNGANRRSAGQAGALTSEGNTRISGNHTRPNWVDMSGIVGGKTGGVAILQHPDNFRFPQFTRIHPSMPYYCFPPVVEEAYDLEKGVPYRSRYRIVSHRDRADPGSLDGMWEVYANAPADPSSEAQASGSSH